MVEEAGRTGWAARDGGQEGERGVERESRGYIGHFNSSLFLNLNAPKCYKTGRRETA
jgi:hypothetical protein